MNLPCRGHLGILWLIALFSLTSPFITPKNDVFFYFVELTVISGLVQSVYLVVFGLTFGEIRDFVLTTLSTSKSLPSVLHLFGVRGIYLGCNSSGYEPDLSSPYIVAPR